VCVDGRRLAVVFAAHELAPAGFGHMPHVQAFGLFLVQGVQCPIPASGCLPVCPADVHVASGLRVVVHGFDAGHEVGKLIDLVHGHGLGLVFERPVLVEASVGAPACDERIGLHHVVVVVVIVVVVGSDFDFKAEGEHVPRFRVAVIRVYVVWLLCVLVVVVFLHA